MSVKSEMQDILIKEFSPSYIELVDQSDHHIGHAGHDGRGESHFLLKMTSDKFKGISRVERQRMVYKALDGFLKGRVHALALKLSAE